MSSLHSEQPNLNQKYQRLNMGDAVSLFDFFRILWRGKWIVIFTTLLITVLTTYYIATTQELWSSKAVVNKPNLRNMIEYQTTVKKYQSLFDVYQDDGTVIISDKLDRITDPEAIFQIFIREFNSNKNKVSFLKLNPYLNEVKEDNIALNDEYALQAFYESWFNKITALPDESPQNLGSYILKFQSTDRNSSLNLLNEYVYYINSIVANIIYSDFFDTINIKRSELVQTEKNISEQARMRLFIEMEKTKHALKIANAAGLKEPVSGLNYNDIFPINIGALALDARLNTLRSIDNLSIFEPRLATLKVSLEQMKLDEKLDISSIKTFNYVEEPKSLTSRDKPKRALLLFLGGSLGFVFGCVILLIKQSFTRWKFEMNNK
ncbi:LPS chain length-determining protein [Vibrio cholerae]|uniref:Wzz/FepE/Etk N-terminal domain-containing protein n=1 Tax=Vibrio cholerae TaxID=666 RepID=UPI001D3B885D|nr:Wzz/FepE/Etk N-terminal domain-containing protein [Vibrio cholerae]EGR4198611.1 LPS chain length-determining protein [Vibrio cholerae]EGR4491706.1 LPS chain length-determining protein [Vibrio cholerae]EKF9749367.1 LPS chain length-determining protein [Vibrio cholerae]MCX9445803.1 LPS chain length-determining protein [Vibrio cholerae]MDV2340239.1 Wzz/FepE/Etk N-terminal domain-containing protein [Vibrio cholerae]